MQLRYGNYAHPASEATIQIAQRELFNEGGQNYAIEQTWNISGFLQAANQAAITAAIAKMGAAYRIQGQNLGFFDDAGNPTAHGVLSKDTLGGVRILEGPQFERGESAEYTSYRYYGIVAQFLLPNPKIRLLSFYETLSMVGTGGPRFAIMQTLQGKPPKQQLSERSIMFATQSGMAVGWRNYPVAPPPIFPDDEHVERRRIEPKNPKRWGPPGRGEYSDFPLSWSYEFESADGLLGTPNRWVD